MGVDIIARGIASGAVRIATDHKFGSNAERDAYFAANPSKLKENLYVFSGDELQQWDGTTWNTMTPAIIGPRGPQGVPGKNAVVNDIDVDVEIKAGKNIIVDTDVGKGTITIHSEGGSGSGEFTNLTPTRVSIGGIVAGDTFDKVSYEDMMTLLLYPEKFPTLTNPSSSFTKEPSGLIEVGVPTDIKFTTNFSQGSINPAYTTNGKRSGLANKYTYTGEGLPAEAFVAVPSFSTTVPDVLFTVPGEKKWTSFVSYDAGPQPYTSEGNKYSSPLPAGNTSVDTLVATAVYPFFATTANITTLTKQQLSNSAYFSISLVGETDIDKQMFEYANVIRCTGVQFYNDLTTKWEYIGGSPASSLATFNATPTTRIIGTETVNYTRLTHNASKTGSRTLRFFMEEV